MKKAIQNCLRNWKTTSAGLALIVGSSIHGFYAVSHGSANENTYQTWAAAMLTGLGFLVSADGWGSPPTPPEIPPPAAASGK
jgi:hypothetical protein